MSFKLLFLQKHLLQILVNNIESIGWRHYSKVDFVRGCVGESARDCVQLWVDTTKTSNVSITCQWTLADGEDTSFLAEQGRRAFVSIIIKSRPRLKHPEIWLSIKHQESSIGHKKTVTTFWL